MSLRSIPSRSLPVLGLVGALVALAACGKDDPCCDDCGPTAPKKDVANGAPSASPAKVPATAAEPDDHEGPVVALGQVTLHGHVFAVERFGEIVPGKEGAIEVAMVSGPAGAALERLSLFAWLEAKDGTQVCAPSKGDLEKGKLHFHLTPRADAKDLTRVVLRLRADGADVRAGLPLDGHGHEHGPTPHDGVVAHLRGPDGKDVGFVELKLHDDKGDLELWVARDVAMKEPFDLPLDTKVKVVFVDHQDRTVELAVRDREQNPDEDGVANVRAGKTNYFVFPGETGADAAWLVGKTFHSIVRLSFSVDGKAYASEEFVLAPHVH